MKMVTAFTDGGSRGNPGPGAIAFVIYENDKEIHKHCQCIGETTNNQAEYRAVLEVLSYIKNHFDRSKVIVNIDSELVVKQLNGEYKVKDEKLKPLFFKVREKIIELGGNIVFIHVRREKNKIADKLVNEALDSKIGSGDRVFPSVKIC